VVKTKNERFSSRCRTKLKKGKRESKSKDGVKDHESNGGRKIKKESKRFNMKIAKKRTEEKKGANEKHGVGTGKKNIVTKWSTQGKNF